MHGKRGCFGEATYPAEALAKEEPLKSDVAGSKQWKKRKRIFQYLENPRFN